MKNAALYLRSSKDRSDVSISAQRQKLLEIAGTRNLTVIREYADVVESAKSENRPAFQDLLTDLRRAGRTWACILMLDHSRLSRQPYVGHVFRYECQKLGVEVIFGNLPELDPISSIVMDSVMDAFSVVHSITSKQKGLAGMAENVRHGWRAGGKAPRGYRLEHVSTGAVRDGSPVLKSVLAPSEDASIVKRYLEARAAGSPRSQVMRDLSTTWAASSLIAIEWNALTYAGHTVWNRHSEVTSSGGYVGRKKMRDRAEWQITRNTHPALITDAEAEALLARLLSSDIGKRISQAKRGISPHLLTTVLETPDGRRWEGWKTYYRVKAGNGLPGRYVEKARLDEAVVGKLVEDFKSEEFVLALVDEAQKGAKRTTDAPLKRLQAEIVGINAQVAKAMDIAMALDDSGPALRKVNELEVRRKVLVDEIGRVEREHATREALLGLTREQAAGLVAGLAEEMVLAEQPRLKGIIAATVGRVTLDPDTLECRVHYRIPVERTLNMASPRGFDQYGAALRMESVLRWIAA